MPSESDIVQKLKASFPPRGGIAGIGDDAAVLPLNDHENYVVTKDILAEHKHFRLSTTDAASLAHKCLHVNLSDIAAMGAVPLFVLLGIALPPSLDDAWVAAFLASFAAACDKQNVQLVGGDTTASESDLFVSITVIGKEEKGNLKFRNGAKAGDVLAVAGDLGEAHAGLMALEKNLAGLEAVKAKSLRPQAKSAEGIWLGKQSGVTAMMDLSDGLQVDAARLAEASQAGVVIDVEQLRTSAELAAACQAMNLDPFACMLAGGEDYGLLLTITGGALDDIARDFQKKFGYALQSVGTVTAETGLTLREGGKKIVLPYRSFSHFGEF